jgi:hypothetical protein
MKPYLLLTLIAGLGLASCAAFDQSPTGAFGANDYAIRREPPNNSEISLAQRRLQNFVRRANARQRDELARYPVVAVQAGEISADEVPGLIYQLAAGQIGTAISYYSSDPDNPTGVRVKFLLLLDFRTGRLVTSEGVLVIDTPPRGRIAEFGGVQAVYADTGWW